MREHATRTEHSVFEGSENVGLSIKSATPEQNASNAEERAKREAYTPHVGSLCTCTRTNGYMDGRKLFGLTAAVRQAVR